MRRARTRRAPSPNPNATPPASTRLLPRTSLKFLELVPANALKTSNPRPKCLRLDSFRLFAGFLSWPGLLLERQNRETEQPRNRFPSKRKIGNLRKRRDSAATAVSNNRVNEV